MYRPPIHWLPSLLPHGLLFFSGNGCRQRQFLLSSFKFRFRLTISQHVRARIMIKRRVRKNVGQPEKERDAILSRLTSLTKSSEFRRKTDKRKCMEKDFVASQKASEILRKTVKWETLASRCASTGSIVFRWAASTKQQQHHHSYAAAILSFARRLLNFKEPA